MKGNVNYLELANSPLMWVGAAIAVGIVVFQSVLFFRKSLKAAKEIGIEQEKINMAIKSSAISSIGPSIVILVTMISLIVSMGAPVSWYCQMGKNHHVIRYHYMFWTGTCYLSCIRMYATGIRNHCRYNRTDQCKWSILYCRTDFLFPDSWNPGNLSDIPFRKYIQHACSVFFCCTGSSRR